MVAFQNDGRPNGLPRPWTCHHHRQRKRMTEQLNRINIWIALRCMALHLPFGSPSLVHVWIEANVSFELMKQTFVVPTKQLPLTLRKRANERTKCNDDDDDPRAGAIKTVEQKKNYYIKKIEKAKWKWKVKKSTHNPNCHSAKKTLNLKWTMLKRLFVAIEMISRSHTLTHASPSWAWVQKRISTAQHSAHRRMQTTYYENIHQV